MKKMTVILSILLAAITACQQSPSSTEVDIDSEKAAIDSVLTAFNAAYEVEDAVNLVSFFTEDATICGTDPSEYFTKQQITELWTEMFASPDIDPSITMISNRLIKVAPDGKSASVVEQFMFPLFTPKIPWRNVYHIVKEKDDWKILLYCSALIPVNEDVPKLNAALE